MIQSIRPTFHFVRCRPNVSSTHKVNLVLSMSLNNFFAPVSAGKISYPRFLSPWKQHKIRQILLTKERYSEVRIQGQNYRICDLPTFFTSKRNTKRFNHTEKLFTKNTPSPSVKVCIYILTVTYRGFVSASGKTSFPTISKQSWFIELITDNFMSFQKSG